MKPLIAGRDECLSEAAMFWNMRKIEGLPRSLVNQLNNVIYTCNTNCIDYFVPHDICMCYIHNLYLDQRKITGVKTETEWNEYTGWSQANKTGFGFI